MKISCCKILALFVTMTVTPQSVKNTFWRMRAHVKDFQASKAGNLTDVSLWVDYFKEQGALLSNLLQCNDFTHLLVYGPSGAGKKTRIMCLLHELDCFGVEKLRIEPQTITALSKRKIEISIIASNYYLKVHTNDAGNSNWVVI